MKRYFQKNRTDIDDPALIEAKDWLMQLRPSRTSPETERKFQEWLSENPANIENFDLMDALWDGLDVLKDNPETVKIMSKRDRRHRTGRLGSWFDQLLGGSPIAQTITAVTTVLILIGGVWLLQMDRSPTTWRTATGEQRDIILADGSRVHLDTETIINANFSKELRQIELEEGQALFSVSHDSSRPFVVTTGRISVLALGTVFKVSKVKGGQVAVAVTEGRVKINRKNGHPSMAFDPDTITAPESLSEKQALALKTVVAPEETMPSLAAGIVISGQEVVVDENNDRVEILPVDKKKIDAWLNGILNFQATPLPLVIDEVNRYLDNKIYIADKDLEGYKISLYFKIAHRNNFLQTLKRVIPIEARHTAAGKVEIIKARG
ncbi:MAG: FecR domain-containing protein [Deltaproteobacteria bacterium]|nr:FecR domain-containing protein [Deltaproteobacteria bacterium]